MGTRPGCSPDPRGPGLRLEVFGEKTLRGLSTKWGWSLGVLGKHREIAAQNPTAGKPEAQKWNDGMAKQGPLSTLS